MSAQLSNEKYYIFSAEKSALDAGKEALKIFFQNQNKSAQIITPGEIKNIKTNENIIITLVGHFHGQAKANPQKLYVSSNKVIEVGEFADLIEDTWKLPKTNIKELRLAACYSDEFAINLAKNLAQRGYSNLNVVGYKGELNVSHGLNGGMIAGLFLDKNKDPVLYKNDFDKDDPNYESGWKIDFEVFVENPHLQAKYAAENYAVSANTSQYLHRPQEAEPAAVASAAAAGNDTMPATASSGPLTRAAKQASGTASRRGSLSEPSDDQLEADLTNRFSNAIGQLGNWAIGQPKCFRRFNETF